MDHKTKLGSFTAYAEYVSTSLWSASWIRILSVLPHDKSDLVPHIFVVNSSAFLIVHSVSSPSWLLVHPRPLPPLGEPFPHHDSVKNLHCFINIIVLNHNCS